MIAVELRVKDEAGKPSREDVQGSSDKDLKSAADSVKAAAQAVKQMTQKVDILQEELKEASFKDLQAGKLIEYGITAGVALMGHFESSSGTAGASQESAAVSTMPYVLLVPGYWALGDTTKTYCATAFANDTALAREAAVHYTRKKIIATLDVQQKKKYDEGDPDTIELVESTAFGHKTGERRKFDGDTNSWDLYADGRCTATRWGIFVGKPMDYEASVLVAKGSSEEKREVSSMFGIGAAYVPNAYVTLLAGISLNTITIPAVEAEGDTEASPEQLRRFVTYMIGFGGNLDIVGTLLK